MEPGPSWPPHELQIKRRIYRMSFFNVAVPQNSPINCICRNISRYRYLYHSMCRYVPNIVYLCDVDNCKNILLENWAALLLLVLCATAAPRRGPRQQSKVIVYGEVGRLEDPWRLLGQRWAARLSATFYRPPNMGHTSNICTDLSKNVVCKPVSAISCP